MHRLLLTAMLLGGCSSPTPASPRPNVCGGLCFASVQCGGSVCATCVHNECTDILVAAPTSDAGATPDATSKGIQ